MELSMELLVMHWGIKNSIYDQCHFLPSSVSLLLKANNFS